MRILALDSSGLVASAAVAEDDILLAEYTVNYKKTHSQTLLPMLDEICRMLELELSTVDAIAVCSGPGSFTGLRIGSATAKGLGLALDKPLVEVPTLEGLAYNLCGADGIICPLMDARRGQVYTGIYESVYGENGWELRSLWDQRAVDIREALERLNSLGRKVMLTGDGVPVYRERIAEGLQVPYALAPSHLNRQRAASVAALGAVYFRMGRGVCADDHQPEYLRMSQAERERLEKGL